MWVTRPLLFPMSYSGMAGDRGVEPRAAGFGGPPELRLVACGSGGMESNHLPTGHESAASPFGFLQWGDQPDSHRYLRVHTPAPLIWTMATVQTGGFEPPSSCLSDRCANLCATFAGSAFADACSEQDSNLHPPASHTVARPLSYQSRRQRGLQHRTGISAATAVTNLHPWSCGTRAASVRGLGDPR